MMEKLTEEDITMLQYFWEEKGDITRWVGFYNKMTAIEDQFPEVMKAWKEYQTSIRTLSAVLNNMSVEE